MKTSVRHSVSIGDWVMTIIETMINSPVLLMLPVIKCSDISQSKLRLYPSGVLITSLLKIREHDGNFRKKKKRCESEVFQIHFFFLWEGEGEYLRIAN